VKIRTKDRTIGIDQAITALIYVFQASAISLPLKIAVNVSQYLQAWETIIWDNAAGNFGITPVTSRPTSLPYSAVQRAINTRIYNFTGRALHEADFTVIGKKLLGYEFGRFLVVLYVE